MNARKLISFATSPVAVILAGCVISFVGFGIRSSFGLFLDPMVEANGWNRSTFALAMALQNLFWGLTMPIAGMLADRYGATRVLSAGALLYFVGVWGMAVSKSWLAMQLTGGVLVGTGIAFSAFALAIAAMAKVVPPSKRTLVMGLGTSVGSLGQAVFSPVGQAFISTFGWQTALFILAGMTLIIIPFALFMPKNDAPQPPENKKTNQKTPQNTPQKSPLDEQTMRQILTLASGHGGYILLTIGFFVCGFHVAFISVHFPAYVTELTGNAAIGGYTLSLIGLFNIIGSLASGAAGQKFSMKNSLTFIYGARALVILGLLLAPKVPITLYIFAALMGLLWLSTVPLTSGIIAQVFGVRYLATLFGIVFLSHQVGSFSGIWLGGYLYDQFGSYDIMWWAGIAFGLLAALLHWGIDERPLGAAKPALQPAG